MILVQSVSCDFILMDRSTRPSHLFASTMDIEVVPLNNGKVLVGGQRGLVRLNADGSLDGSFDPLAFGNDFKNVVQLVKLGDRVLASNGSAIRLMNGEGKRRPLV